jgi:hypothetical protein
VLIAAQNYQAIVRPLQWFVVILIFIFFARVVRAVFVEASPGGRRREQDAKQRSRGFNVEVVEPSSIAGQRFSILPEQDFTIGRSGVCSLSIHDDVYASTHHAKIFRAGSHLMAEDLGSTNGTYVNAERIVRPTRLTKGDLVQVGATILEVTR